MRFLYSTKEVITRCRYRPTTHDVVDMSIAKATQYSNHNILLSLSSTISNILNTKTSNLIYNWFINVSILKSLLINHNAVLNNRFWQLKALRGIVNFKIQWNFYVICTGIISQGLFYKVKNIHLSFKFNVLVILAFSKWVCTKINVYFWAEDNFYCLLKRALQYEVIFVEQCYGVHCCQACPCIDINWNMYLFMNLACFFDVCNTTKTDLTFHWEELIIWKFREKMYSKSHFNKTLKYSWKRKKKMHYVCKRNE